MCIENLRFSCEPTSVTVAMVERLFDSLDYGKESAMLDSEDMVASLFAPGSHGFFAFDTKSRLAGLARVLSDDRSEAWIAELAVSPRWQALGLGEALIDRVVQRFSHTTIHFNGLPQQLELLAQAGIHSCSHCVDGPDQTLRGNEAPAFSSTA